MIIRRMASTKSLLASFMSETTEKIFREDNHEYT